MGIKWCGPYPPRGMSHEAAGNCSPRWMIVRYRTRLTVCPDYLKKAKEHISVNDRENRENRENG